MGLNKPMISSAPRFLSGVLLLCFCPAVRGAPQNSFVLAQGGKTQYTIDLPDKPSEVEQFSAEELQKYLKKMSGATFPIAVHHGAHSIFIGRAATPQLVEQNDPRFDGFSYEAQPGVILLAGA